MGCIVRLSCRECIMHSPGQQTVELDTMYTSNKHRVYIVIKDLSWRKPSVNVVVIDFIRIGCIPNGLPAAKSPLKIMFTFCFGRYK